MDKQETLVSKVENLENRKNKLNDKLLSLNKEISENDIEEVSPKLREISSEMVQVETELKITELALNKVRGELQKEQTWRNSKEFKDKLLKIEELRKVSIEKSSEFLNKVERLLKEADKIIEMTQEIDRLNSETDNQQTFPLSMTEPYGWVVGTRNSINTRLKQKELVEALRKP